MKKDGDGRGRARTRTNGSGLGRTGTDARPEADGTDGDGRGWMGADGMERTGTDTDRSSNEAKKSATQMKKCRRWFQAPKNGPIFAPGKRRPSSSVSYLRS